MKNGLLTSKVVFWKKQAFLVAIVTFTILAANTIPETLAQVTTVKPTLSASNLPAGDWIHFSTTQTIDGLNSVCMSLPVITSSNQGVGAAVESPIKKLNEIDSASLSFKAHIDSYTDLLGYETIHVPTGMFQSPFISIVVNLGVTTPHGDTIAMHPTIGYQASPAMEFVGTIPGWVTVRPCDPFKWPGWYIDDTFVGMRSLTEWHTYLEANCPNYEVSTINVRFGHIPTWDYPTIYVDDLTIGNLNIERFDFEPWLSPDVPLNPLCEGQTNPTDIKTLNPTFSWSFNDPDLDDIQSAWQIQVSTEPDSAGTVMWDSGKVVGTDSSTSYGGSILTWGATYHWRVKTWDNHDAEGPYCTDQTFETIPFIMVDVDVKPGTESNSVNLKSKSLLPVAIMGSSSFDVTTINPATINIAEVYIAPQGSAKKPKLAYSFKDVNSDGYSDLVANFEIQALVNAGALTPTTVSLTLKANLYDATQIEGTDSVNIVTR